MKPFKDFVPLTIPGANIQNIGDDIVDYLEKVVYSYCNKTKEELIQMTHNDSPWKDVSVGEKISKESIRGNFSYLLTIHNSYDVAVQRSKRRKTLKLRDPVKS